jgi:hypothetical protein
MKSKLFYSELREQIENRVLGSVDIRDLAAENRGFYRLTDI